MDQALQGHLVWQLMRYHLRLSLSVSQMRDSVWKGCIECWSLEGHVNFMIRHYSQTSAKLSINAPPELILPPEFLEPSTP